MGMCDDGACGHAGLTVISCLGTVGWPEESRKSEFERKLIDQILRNNSSDIPYNTMKYQALSEMSVAIQRENGNMFWRTLRNLFNV